MNNLALKKRNKNLKARSFSSYLLITVLNFRRFPKFFAELKLVKLHFLSV